MSIDPHTWIEVSKTALTHNISAIRSTVGKDTKIAATVKADAYGHGLLKTVKVLQNEGIDWFCVYAAEAALRLREAGVRQPILILGVTREDQLVRLIEKRVDLMVASRAHADAITHAAQSAQRPARVHANIDTGMSRYGIHWKEARDFIQTLKDIPDVDLIGVYSHFATADDPDTQQFHDQHERFAPIADLAPVAHCSNSAAMLASTQTHFDMVRPGIAIYGYSPGELLQNRTNISLKPVLSFHTTVTQTKQLPAGASIGYGATNTLDRPAEIAILPAGYYDGISRQLSNTGVLLVHGQRAPILGRVCMNNTMIDITDISDVSIGDAATIIGEQNGKQITATDIATNIDTIPYEILTRIRSDLERCYVD